MLSSVGRAAARRLLTTRLPSTAISSSIFASQLLRSAGRPVLARSFAVSSRAYQPAAAAGDKKTSTSAKPKAKKAATKTTKAKAPKKKAAPVKKAAEKKPEEELDPETKLKLAIREEKKKTLVREEPDKLPETAWIQFLTRELRGSAVGGPELAKNMAQFSVKFKELPAYEVEELTATADANKKTNAAAYKTWVESYPVERIYLANLARKRLSRLSKKRVATIHDHRQLPNPPRPYTLFVKARFSAPGGSPDTITRMKELAVEWKALSESDRKAFEDLAAGDIATWKRAAEEIRARAEALKKQDVIDKQKELLRRRERKLERERERRAAIKAAKN